jgi:hypothetical protein
MPGPAPAGPQPSLSTFDGSTPTARNLFIRDDLGGGNGFIINDPTLTITTTDVTPPETVQKPEASGTREDQVHLNEAGATFECKVDSRSSPCSPRKLKNLKFGKHKFRSERSMPQATSTEPGTGEVDGHQEEVVLTEISSVLLRRAATGKISA